MREYIKFTALKSQANERQKAAKAHLFGFAEINPDLKDEDGNIVLRGGYIHYGKETVVSPCEGFVYSKFVQDYPELVKIEIKVAPLKAILTNDEAREKMLANHCVSLTEEDTVEVIIDKKS
jgi:hypothetical protein